LAKHGRKGIRGLFEAGRSRVFHFAPSIDKTLRLLAEFRAVLRNLPFGAEFPIISNYYVAAIIKILPQF